MSARGGKGGGRPAGTRYGRGAVEPEIPAEVELAEIDPGLRRELTSLPADVADRVATHLGAAVALLDEDPVEALAHARFAQGRAARVGTVREIAGVAAYRAGEWSEALGELRAGRRLRGDAGLLAMMADCERALGRPERALELAGEAGVADLAVADRVEVWIVAAGARRDLGQIEASVVALQVDELNSSAHEPWVARLRYAYADNLAAADRVAEARRWFEAAARADAAGQTDADERAAELVEPRDSV